MYSVKVLCCENLGLLHSVAVKAIEKSEGTDFNHVAILLNGFVYEAVFPRARKISKYDWDKLFRTIRTYEIELNELEYRLFLEQMLAQHGKPYSVFQCAMIWLSNSVGVLERFIERIVWNGNKALICSEFVARPLIKAKDFKFENEPDTVGMDEIETCLKILGKVVPNEA